jgi:hypothetical protein
MKELKAIALKFGLLGLLLAVLNLVYTHLHYQQDLREYSPDHKVLMSIHRDTEVLYIGESSNSSYRSEDLDKRSIGQFLDGHFPETQIQDITRPASHMGIYHDMLASIPQEIAPKILVITCNLRSFNAQWIHSDMETPLRKSMVLLAEGPPLWNRARLSFKDYEINTSKEQEHRVMDQWAAQDLGPFTDAKFQNVIQWDRHIAETGIKNEEGMRDEEKTLLATHYVKAFAFVIDTVDNPRIADIENVLNLCEQRGYVPVMNILAENVDKAQELIGDDLYRLMKKNEEILLKFFADRGIRVINNLESVRDPEFTDQDWTTEHYSQKGRMTIADNIAEEIAPLVSGPIIQELKAEISTSFFHDCELERNWGQERTFTGEEHYSGSTSSLIDKNSPFSITLEYPYHLVPDSLKESVRISAALKRMENEDKITLVIEGLDGPSHYWKDHGAEGVSEESEMEDWSIYSWNVPITKELRTARVIKVYFMNESKSPQYIDDMQVEFR